MNIFLTLALLVLSFFLGRVSTRIRFKIAREEDNKCHHPPKRQKFAVGDKVRVSRITQEDKDNGIDEGDILTLVKRVDLTKESYSHLATHHVWWEVKEHSISFVEDQLEAVEEEVPDIINNLNADTNIL